MLIKHFYILHVQSRYLSTWLHHLFNSCPVAVKAGPPAPSEHRGNGERWSSVVFSGPLCQKNEPPPGYWRLGLGTREQAGSAGLAAGLGLSPSRLCHSGVSISLLILIMRSRLPINRLASVKPQGENPVYRLLDNLSTAEHRESYKEGWSSKHCLNSKMTGLIFPGTVTAVSGLNRIRCSVGVIKVGTTGAVGWEIRRLSGLFLSLL